MQELMELVKERGFLWPSFEIYGGTAGFYDLGPMGSLLRDNLIRKWKEFYIWGEGYLQLETPTLVPFEVLKASGHVDHFSDLMGQCKSCGESFRMSDLMKERGVETEGLPKEEVEKLVREKGVRCASCGGELSLSEFNIMFSTSIGPGSKHPGFMRPETAQQIFIAFRRLFRHGRGKLPLGVVTVGKGYRNEISPRQGVIRLREFTMAEAEVFFDPRNPRPSAFLADEKLRLLLASGELEVTAGEAAAGKLVCNEMMAHQLALAKRFLVEVGLQEGSLRFREQKPAERAHYSSQTFDLEVLTRQFGWVEVAGIAYRTDYDLSRHSSFSGVDLSVTVGGRKFFPHVIEPSFGIDRIFYCVLEQAYTQQEKRRFLRLKADLAPIQVGVFPLMPKEDLSARAREIYQECRKHFSTIYDESGSIGRRYVRADEVGTPYCVTIDYQTLADGSVTIRDRDTAEQVRVSEPVRILAGLISGKLRFRDAGPLFFSKEQEEGEGKQGEGEEN